MPSVRRSGARWTRATYTTLALLSAVAAACGDDGGNVGPAPTITVTATPATLSVAQGQSGAVQVALTRGGGYTNAVTLAATGAPTGVTPTFSPASLTGTTAASTLTLATTATTAPGTYPITIAGSGSGVTTASQTVALTVTAAQQTLTLTRAGTGTGTVTSAPAGINCGTTCAAPFANGTAVTLTAAAATGSTFAGWTGACTGASATCTVTMSAAQTVTATFNTAATTNALTVTKTGTGTGTVSSAPAGIDCGATCSAGFTSGASVTLTATPSATSFFGGWSGACTGTAATCTVTMSQAQSANAVFTANPAGSFTLAVAPTTVSLPQGGTGTATVTVTRANGFAGAVNLAVTGAPNGLSVTPNPASATGGTATLNVTATAATAPGTYPITVTGTGTGVAQQTATFNVTVTASGGGGGGGNIKYAFCAPDLPIWVAYQSGTGAWTKLTAGANNTYSFDVTTRGGVAYVMQHGTSYDLTVVYGTAAELTSGGTAPCTTFPTGTKHLTGSVANVPATGGAIVSLGTDFQFVIGAMGSTFAFDSLPDGPLNLVASRFALDLSNGSFGAPDKIILRRGVNYANNSAIPTLDFNGSEAFAPATATLSIANLGTDEAAVGVSYFTGLFGLGAFSLSTGGATQTYAGIPTAQLQANDLHSLFVSASPANDEASSRGLITYFRTVANRTATLGAALSTPTIASIGSTPYVRLRAQLASQSTYGQMATVDFTQTDRSATVSMTNGYAGGTPATWDLSIPDLSAAGFDPTWALRAGVQTTWDVSAFGGNFLQFISGLPTEGATVQYAMKSGTLASALRGSFSRAPRATSSSPVAKATQRADRARRALTMLRR